MVDSKALLIAVLLIALPSAFAASVVVNQSDAIGTVPTDFYGSNVQTRLLANQTLSTGASSNETWLRTASTNASIYAQRQDTNNYDNYIRLFDPEMEQWVNTSVQTTSTFQNVPFGNRIAPSSSTCNVTRTTDAHGGTYASNVTTIAGSLCSYAKALPLNAATGYNASVWIKSSNTITLRVQGRTSFSTLCSANSAASGSWEQVSCAFNVTGTPEAAGYWFSVETGSSESAIVDDYNLTRSGSIVAEWKNNLSEQQEYVSWANTSNVTVLFTFDYTAGFLSKWTTSCYSTSNFDRCNTTDVNAEAALAVDFVNITSQNGAYRNIMLEFFNEYDLFMETSATCSAKAANYVARYAAVYAALKGNFSWLDIGGPTGTSTVTDTNCGITLNNAFIGNFSPSSVDFYTYHDYFNGEDAYDSVNATIVALQALASAQGTTLPSVIWQTEGNQVGCSMLNSTPTQAASELAGWYLSMMRTSVSTGSSYLPMVFRYAINTNATSDCYEQLSQPELLNTYYATYNETQSFAIAHPLGDTIYSTTDAGGVRSLASSNSNTNGLTIQNPTASTVSVDISLANGDEFTLTDAHNGSTYTSSGGTYSLSMLAETVRDFTFTDDNCISSSVTCYLDACYYSDNTLCPVSQTLAAAQATCTSSGCS